MNNIIQIPVENLKYYSKNSKTLPSLTDGEMLRLSERIDTYGFTEALDITKDLIVLDGNHRLKVVRSRFPDIKTLPCRVIDIDKSMYESYVRDKNMDRRHLSRLMQSYLQGKNYNTLKGQVTGNVADDLSIKYNVSPRSIKRYGVFAENIDYIASVYSWCFVFDLLNGYIYGEYYSLNILLINNFTDVLKDFIAVTKNKSFKDIGIFNIDSELTALTKQILAHKDSSYWKVRAEIINAIISNYNSLPSDFIEYTYSVETDSIIESQKINIQEQYSDSLKKEAFIDRSKADKLFLSLRDYIHKFSRESAIEEQEYYHEKLNDHDEKIRQRLVEINKRKELIHLYKSDTLSLCVNNLKANNRQLGTFFIDICDDSDTRVDDSIITSLCASLKQVISDNYTGFVIINSKDICKTPYIFSKYFDYKNTLIYLNRTYNSIDSTSENLIPSYKAILHFGNQNLSIKSLPISKKLDVIESVSSDSPDQDVLEYLFSITNISNTLLYHIGLDSDFIKDVITDGFSIDVVCSTDNIMDKLKSELFDDSAIQLSK